MYAKEDFTDEDGIRACELEAEFAEMDGWNAESDAATLLNGLGIETDLHYSSDDASLNGSEKVKVLLAQRTVRQPGHPAARRAYQPSGSGCNRMAGRIFDQFRKYRHRRIP